MKRLTFSLLCFVAATFLVAESVSAQDIADPLKLIQSDYDKYARLFQMGKDPDFSRSQVWRQLHRDNKWKEYAEGTEFREPFLAAEVLGGIYLVSSMDSLLSSEIDHLVVGKERLPSMLLERFGLDLAGTCMQDCPMLAAAMATHGKQFTWKDIPQNEIVKIQTLIKEIDMQLSVRRLEQRRSTLPEARLQRIRAIRALLSRSEQGWLPLYYSMRENFLMLNTLQDSFAFNLAEEDQKPRLAVYKHLVGTYKILDFHKESLDWIDRRFSSAAQKGDPIAQYHYALFLRYLGDIRDPSTSADVIKSESMKWLEKAGSSDVAKKRVSELIVQLAEEDKQAEKRAESMQKKIEILVKIENEKMDILEDVLILIAKRLAK